MARSAVINLPSDIVALILEQNGLENLSGLRERCACSLVCRSWHAVLSQPQFQQAGRINVGRFDKLARLGRHLHRFCERQPHLRELEWHGHLQGDSRREEQHLLQPVLIASWSQLRVLRLSDCAVSADCLASVGAACPSLEELRYRTASASYSPERVTARSELVYNTHIMRIVQGCKQLKVLDVACRGSTPFARHYEPSLVDSIVDALPLLTELTIFGRFAWSALGSLGAMSQLRRLTLFGLDSCTCDSPPSRSMVALPQISTYITNLTLEEYALDHKTIVPLANSLPSLEELHVCMVPLAPIVEKYSPGLRHQLIGRTQYTHAAMDADRLKGMSAMAVYYGQPFGKSFSMSVRMMDKSELWRELHAEQHT